MFLDHASYVLFPQALVARTTPLFLTFCLHYKFIFNKFVNRKLEKGGWSVPRAPVLFPIKY